MGTGLERHIGSGAACRLAGDFQRLPFGMRAAANGGHGFGDDLPVFDEHTANRWVGKRLALMAERNLDCPSHESFVIGTGGHG